MDTLIGNIQLVLQSSLILCFKVGGHLGGLLTLFPREKFGQDRKTYES